MKNLKKCICILLSAIAVIAFTGCSSESTQVENKGEEYAENTDVEAKSFDIDLTSLSSTMVYSEVYNMMYTPDDYVGKTVKMTGTFAVGVGEERNYYACLIADALACCSQGIEFVWDGEHSYPDDYPEPGASITVTGVFDTYYEGDYVYCQLIDAELDY